MSSLLTPYMFSLFKIHFFWRKFVSWVQFINGGGKTLSLQCSWCMITCWLCLPNFLKNLYLSSLTCIVMLFQAYFILYGSIFTLFCSNFKIFLDKILVDKIADIFRHLPKMLKIKAYTLLAEKKMIQLCYWLL